MNEEDFRNGQVLLIDKPLNWTSFQVVNKIRWLIKNKFAIKKIKVGHAGTLDPMATGLMILAINRGTKFSSYFLESDKSYYASIQLGSSTDTDDAMGNIISSSDIINFRSIFKDYDIPNAENNHA